MARERRHIFENIDWWLVGIYLFLLIFGLLNIYAAVYDEGSPNIFDFSQRYGKQLVWIAAALFLAFGIILIEPKFFNQFSWAVYGLTLITLVGVLLFGKEVAGSKSWFQIGSFAIQPAEFVKFSTALALAHYLSDLQTNFKQFNTKVIVGLLIGVPIALILLQNDTGSALVFASFIFVLYRVGLSGNIFIIGFVLALLAVLALLLSTIQQKLILTGIMLVIAGLAYFFMRRNIANLLRLIVVYLVLVGYIFSVDYAFSKLQPHQQIRIKVLLNMESDPKGAGYNVIQSKIAIGSGGFFGKGFLNGTQTKFNFVPEQSTDFIFCTVGEEWGFVGSLTVVSLFVALLVRIIMLAERQRSGFSRIYGYGLASILFMHFTVNVGMVMGLLPVIGIPLPFISYGGSSLWAFTLMLFVFVRQDAERLQLL